MIRYRLLVVICIILVIIGFIGSIAPLLPGAVLSIIGLYLIQFHPEVETPLWILMLCTMATIISMIVDYYLPIWWTEKYGGTKRGMIWSTLWLFAGIVILPPLGMIILPCIWAFLGEYYISKLHGKAALRAARWSFVGFMISNGYKLILSGIILVIVLSEVSHLFR